MRISLAAKCQILFGAAVILIIAAALLVPWQRMEQLTDQITTSFARGLAYNAARDHAAAKLAEQLAPATTLPTTVPARPEAARLIAPPRLRLLFPGGQAATLTPFEQRATKFFTTDSPASDPYVREARNEQGQKVFRYAWPLHADPLCLNCHARDIRRRSASEPATVPAMVKGRGPLIGMVVLAVPAQVERFDVLLNRTFVFLAGLLAGVLAIVVFYFITTKVILRPVRVLRETAEKASTGNLEVRSHISTGDEFQQLSESFNKMLANLKESEDHLRAINKSLDSRMGQLAESNVALYESNRLKSEFLANVSHELRTPLNSILGFAELLRDSPGGGDARAARYIQNILSSGRNLLDLINDLLDLAKIEAGRMEVRCEPLSLTDLIEGLVGIIRPLAEQKQLEIVANIASDVPLMQSDGPKLQQILYNFVSNAIKFSPAGSRIEVRAARAGDEMVRIAVRDEGPGIDPAKHAVIFEKFRQLDASVTREHSGTGLGLAISKELVTLLGGSIGLSSAPGQGATFWIVVPIKVQAEAQEVEAKPAST